jgi:hypothetical protein
MTATKIFLDTEFTGLHQNSTLISLGMVAETGEKFYAEFADYDKSQLTDWLQENVIKKLHGSLPPSEKVIINSDFVQLQGSRMQIAGLLKEWLTRFKTIEIWADVLAYDWVLFCELFGGALDIPENIFFAPFDLSTVFRIKGIIEPADKYNKDISRFEYAGVENTGQHNALEDAKVQMICLEKLMNL